MAPGLLDTRFFLLVLFVLCDAQPMSLQDQSTHPTVVEAKAWELRAGSCTAFDISVSQGEASGVGLPTWAVQIVNTCINPKCSISDVIVQCGRFHSGSFVNPNVFRLLDSSQGTCIVNNGNVIGNGEVLTFQYQEEFEEPLRLKSAKVYCN